MKVVHLNTFGRGGAFIASLRLHNQLLKEGIDSHFLVLYNFDSDRLCLVNYSHQITFSDRIDYLLNKDKINYFDKVKSGILDGFDWFSSPLSYLRPENLELIKSADIICLNWVSDFINWPSFFKKLGNKSIIWTLHDQNPFTGGCHYAGDCTQYNDRCLDCIQISNGKSVQALFKVKVGMQEKFKNLKLITPSKWLKKCAKDSYLFKELPIVQIPNGVPSDIYQLEGLDLYEKLNISYRDRTLLFVSDSIENKRKGYRRLLEALTYLDNINYPLTCLLIGEGAALTSTFKNHRILQIGKLHSDEELACAYRTANLFVIASKEDNYPNTIIESLCCGTPVVGYDTTGIAEMITDDFGIKADPVADNSLAIAIQTAFNFPFDREIVSNKAKAIWDVEIMAKNYLHLFDEVLNQKIK